MRVPSNIFEAMTKKSVLFRIRKKRVLCINQCPNEALLWRTLFMAISLYQGGLQ